MSLISGLKNIAKNVGLASLGPAGLLIKASQNKAADGKAQAGPQQAGNKGTNVGSNILKALLFPPALFMGK